MALGARVDRVRLLVGTKSATGPGRSPESGPWGLSAPSAAKTARGSGAPPPDLMSRGVVTVHLQRAVTLVALGVGVLELARLLGD